MPDDTKIFDVSKPGRTAAGPTSRPIIPDQNSTGIDNMVKDYSQPAAATSTTPIHVSMADEEPANVMAQPNQQDMPSLDEEPQQNHGEVFHPPAGATIPPHELDEPHEQPAESSGGGNFTPLSKLIPNSNGKDDTGEYGAHH